MRIKTRVASLMLVRAICMSMAMLLAACSEQAPDPATTAPTTQKKQQSSVVVDPFVKAVTVTVGEAPVEVRFELPERPLVGHAVPLHLRLVGLFDSTQLSIKLQPSEPLQVVDAADWSLRHCLRVSYKLMTSHSKAGAEGMYMLEVVVQATRDGYAKSFTYAIPVVFYAADAASSSAAAAS